MSNPWRPHYCPPDSWREVEVSFGGRRIVRAFFFAPHSAYYRSGRARGERRSVHPRHWREIQPDERSLGKTDSNGGHEMPSGNFRDAWLDEAKRQGPMRRLAMRAVAKNGPMMRRLEQRAEQLAEERGETRGSWSTILAALLPALLKLLQEWLESR